MDLMRKGHVDRVRHSSVTLVLKTILFATIVLTSMDLLILLVDKSAFLVDQKTVSIVLLTMHFARGVTISMRWARARSL